MKPLIILDTDLGGDIDDVGAVAVLNALADLGRCEIAAIVSDTSLSCAVTCIDAINRVFGRPNVPIGRPARLEERPSYARAVADRSPEALKGEDAPLALDLCRRTLAAAPDGGVVIATIGVLLHLNALLDSPADAISPLTGMELVRAKVRRVVTMGGAYPRSPVERPETNFLAWGQSGATRRFVERCPAPLVFCGVELGHRREGYGTGTRLESLPEHDPVRVAYRAFFNHPPRWVVGGPWETIQPWSIWDQITTYYAAVGPCPEFEEVRGHNHVADDGGNHFEPSPTGPHTYLRALVPPEQIANDLIEPLMLQRPTIER